MSQTTSQNQTVRMMTEFGGSRIPADSGIGHVFRPFAQPGHARDRSQRLTTLETLYDFFINDVPDPDSAMAQDPNFDEKLRQQPDVHACMTLREMTVSSLPMRIEASTARNIDAAFSEKVADYVTDTFNVIPGVSDLYLTMQNAVLMGGQGVEFLWNMVDGSEKPTDWFPVHKSRFRRDRLGNMAILTRQTPVYGTYVNPDPAQGIPGPTALADGSFASIFPPGKFLYHVYRRESGSWNRPADEGYIYWGRGEDTRLYIPVTFDQFVLRFRMKWMEKHGMPLTVLHHPDNQANTSEILRIAESIRGEGIVTIPKPTGENTADHYYKLDFIEPPKMGFDAFQEFTERWTRPAVEKILLGGANLMAVGDSGSYGATVGQRDAGAAIIFRKDSMRIDETINRQLIPAIVQAQWPGCPIAYYPRHTITPEEAKNQELNMRVLEVASRLVRVREDDVYDAAGLERPKEDEATVFTGQAMNPSAEDPFNEGGSLFPPDGNIGSQPKAGIGETADSKTHPLKADKGSNFEAEHAPTGGVSVGDSFFPGGQFIPSDVMDKATDEEKQAVKGESKAPASPVVNKATAIKPQAIIRQGFKAIEKDAKGNYSGHDPKIAERLKSLRLPPAWTNVQLSDDDKAPLQAIGRDSKGRSQYVYSSEHSAKASAEKFGRLKELVGELPLIRHRREAALNNPKDKNHEQAVVLYLIEQTGFRIGGESDTKAEKEAKGATTLETSNVHVIGDKVRFDFVGKKGVRIQQEISDPALAKMIKPRLSKPGKLFDTNDSSVRDYLHSIDGKFKVKDFRTAKAADTAIREIGMMEAPKTEKDFAKARMAVAKAVAAKLGNTPTVALASYIPPEVFESWKTNLKK